MLAYFILILLSLAILFSYYKYFKNNNLRKISGPFPLPFFGNVLSLNCAPEKVWLILLDFVKKYGSTFRLWYFSTPIILLTDPEDVKVLLKCKKNINKSYFVYTSMKTCSETDGLLFSRAEKWRKRRKLITPAFGPELLKQYANSSIELVEKFVSFTKSQGDETAVELKSTMLHLTLKIVCKAIMGFDLDSRPSSEKGLYLQLLEEFTEIYFYRTCRPYIRDWMVPFLNIGRRLKRVLQMLHSYSDIIIEKRREIKNFVDSDIKSEESKLKSAFFDLLFSAEAENLIDKKGIRDEVIIFAVAGFDTTGVSLIFTLMLLAENMQAQNLAREEISSIMDENGGKLNFADVNKLNYVERCIKEAMRLFPSALFFGRRITEELQLSTFGLPVNSDAIVFTYAIHRNPKYWPHPDKFDPDRFLPEQVQNRHPYAYLPFSAGIRNCIGYKFAMLEMKIVVAYILYNFEVEPINRIADVRMTSQVPLNISDSLFLKFIKRKQL